MGRVVAEDRNFNRPLCNYNSSLQLSIDRVDRGGGFVACGLGIRLDARKRRIGVQTNEARIVDSNDREILRHDDVSA